MCERANETIDVIAVLSLKCPAMFVGLFQMQVEEGLRLGCFFQIKKQFRFKSLEGISK